MREMQFMETSADNKRSKHNNSGIKTGSSKNSDLLKVKRRQEEDSATLLLKSSKSLLKMHETESYCKQTTETKSDI